MTMQMRNTGPPLTDERVRQLEAFIGYDLPPDFRAFLLKHNGGQPGLVVIDVEGLPGTPASVHVFFGLDRAPPFEFYNLEWRFRACPGQIRSDLCPFACDDGGNLYCLVLSGRDRGMVYHVDLNPQTGAIWYGRPEPEDRCEYRVAESFSDFLGKLHEFTQ